MQEIRLARVAAAQKLQSLLSQILWPQARAGGLGIARMRSSRRERALRPVRAAGPQKTAL